MSIDLSNAFIIFVIGHLVITIWWAATINSTIKNLISDVKDMKNEIKGLRDIIFTRDDATRELEIADKEHRALWQRIETVEKKVEGVV